LQHTIAYNPKKNGVVEKKNRSLKEMASRMLHEKSLQQILWDEAFNCATYIKNRSPHRYFKGKNPYKDWRVNKLEVFVFLREACVRKNQNL
jgi:hypothetical protein